MLTWDGQTAPPLDPYKRELHNVPMHYAMVERADSAAVRCLIHIGGLITAFFCGFAAGECK